MVTTAGTKICLLWYRIVRNPSLGSIPWNNDARADPDALVGGIPFAQGAMMDEPLFIFACGTGDAGIALNTGPLFNPLAEIPDTFVPGWPSFTGPFGDTFDPASGQGSAVINGPNVAFPNIPGACNSLSGQRVGRYYFEYTVSYDIFSQQAGCGIMRLGSQLNFIQQGRKSSTDNIGGPMIQGGNIGTVPQYQPSVQLFNVGVQSSPLVPAPGGTVMGVAVALIPYAYFIPSLFSAVPLPSLICCPDQRQRYPRPPLKR